MKKNLKRIAPVAVLAALLLGMLSACKQGDEATPTSSCAFRVGDGKDGRSANIKGVYFPGQVISRDQNDSGGFKDRVKYFPCNARNFIVNDGKQKDANGHRVGDRFTLTQAFTKEGTPVLIAWKAFWTPNQNKEVLERSFFPFCFKYKCWSSTPDSGDANFSTTGWNGMLGESMSPAGDSVMFKYAHLDLTDASWDQRHDSAEWQKLEQDASVNFADEIRPYTGVADDLFCGSGTSVWSNPAKPGEGTFDCKPVRFKVEAVINADPEMADLATRLVKAQKEKEVNDAELKAAESKYGNLAGYFLGLQDTLAKCQSNQTTCVVTLGGNAPGISLPVPAK